ncbi:MAG TPA: diaminopimelate decarboxylase [Hyphomicrobiaceae bacterium]|jgi:diaminopimelate decarboxylase|nr:diaminopimelate decarboxylase [Hyphomicrobiaceae bacterium]
MHHFSYRGGVLHAENVNLARLAQEVDTPFYCYSTATLVQHYRVLTQAFADSEHLICYAVKANSNQAVLKTLARLGAGMDVVSEGELRRARLAGVPPNRIIFAGVGKTREEIAYALAEGILGFNVESEAELNRLSEIASRLEKSARVAIRVNPDVDAKTHAKIATGRAENKFGVPFLEAPRLYAQAAQLAGIKIAGIHMHIGSQITDLKPFRDAFGLLRELVVELRRSGHEIEHLDLGGGLGVRYRGADNLLPHPDEYAAVVKAAVGDLGLKLIFEPGRIIAGNAGVLVTRVLYRKRSIDKTFTIIDAAMNDLIRPTLYDAYHEVWPVWQAKSDSPAIVQDLVGPVCETGDYFALNRSLPLLESGDLLAVMTAGAYGAVMSSTYNTRRLVPEVLVRGTEYAVVRPRPSYEELIGLDRLPDWLRDD